MTCHSLRDEIERLRTAVVNKDSELSEERVKHHQLRVAIQLVPARSEAGYPAGEQTVRGVAFLRVGGGSNGGDGAPSTTADPCGPAAAGDVPTPHR